MTKRRVNKRSQHKMMLQLFELGLNQKEIAKEMGVSPKTIYNWRKEIEEAYKQKEKDYLEDDLNPSVLHHFLIDQNIRFLADDMIIDLLKNLHQTQNHQGYIQDLKSMQSHITSYNKHFYKVIKHFEVSRVEYLKRHLILKMNAMDSLKEAYLMQKENMHALEEGLTKPYSEEDIEAHLEQVDFENPIDQKLNEIRYNALTSKLRNANDKNYRNFTCFSKKA